MSELGDAPGVEVVNLMWKARCAPTSDRRHDALHTIAAIGDTSGNRGSYRAATADRYAA